VWEANYRCYGARRVWLALAREQVAVARCTVERLMAEMGIRGVQRGARRRTTIADPSAPRAPDLVERRFVAERPNDLWLADITYASSWEGWLYVSFIIDVFSRMIVGWQIADHLRTDLVLDALEMAIFCRDVAAAGGDGDLITINWIYWYNDTRLHGEIGDIPPAEYESNWYNNQRTGQPALTH
jgi:transposase InsO family protein